MSILVLQCISGIIYNFSFGPIFCNHKYVHLGKNTSIFYSRIIVVHVHETIFFSKGRPACHTIAKD